jgi:PQQ-like domain
MRHVLRVVAVGALSALLGGCFWPTPGQNPDRTAHNPFETAISPATVGQLTQAWSWDAGSNHRVHGPVTSTAGVHVVDDSDCTLATINADTGAVIGEPVFFLPPNPDPSIVCGISTLGDPFVADGRVWVGRESVLLRNPPSPFAFYEMDTRGWSLEDGSIEVLPEMMVDNLRGDGAVVTGPRGRVATSGPPPIFQYLVVYDMAVGQLGGTVSTLDLRADSPSAVVDDTTQGTSAIYEAGRGVLATDPGDPTVGNGVRAYPMTPTEPGCGPSNALQECPLWATPIDGTSAWRPVLGDQGATLYVGTDAGTVYAIDAATGAVQWTAAVGSAVTGSPALADGSLFVPTASGDLVVLAADGCGASSCDPVWSGSAGSAIGRQPAVAGGVVFTASDDGTLHGFDAGGCGGGATCTDLWSTSTGARISGGPIVSSGQLYVTVNGENGSQGGLLAYGLP